MRQAKPFARYDEPLTKGLGRWQWVVPKELNDCRDVTDLRDGCVAFPIDNRHFVNANFVSYLRLEEIEVKTARADMVA